MKYTLNKTFIKADEKTYITYGISAGEFSIKDISCDKEVVERMVKRFNKNKLSIIHFNSVVEDYMAICQ